jgi:hypothetical protein
LILVAGSALMLSACSGGSPAAVHKNSNTNTTNTTLAAPCTPSSISASVQFTKFGGSSSSLAGGLLFRDSGSSRCSLSGVPRVEVVAPGGGVISTYQAAGPSHNVAVSLTPSSSTAQAASSITFSSWGCTPGSFTLTVQFPGWTGSVPADSEGSTTSTTGPTSNVTGPPCTAAKEVNQTIYISPVTAVTS